jgi:hypothetical protein
LNEFKLAAPLNWFPCEDKQNGHMQYQLQNMSLQVQGVYKSLARPERKYVTATEDFDIHISYL